MNKNMTEKYAPAKHIVKKLEEQLAYPEYGNTKDKQYKCENISTLDDFYQAECKPLQIRREDGYRPFMVKEVVDPEHNITNLHFGVMYNPADEDIMMDLVCDNNKGSRNKCKIVYRDSDLVRHPRSMMDIMEKNEVPDLNKRRYDWFSGMYDGRNRNLRIYISQQGNEKIPTISFSREKRETLS